MKVAAFCGSGRKQGNTALLLRAVLEPLAKAGAETELVELAGSELRGCMRCYVCFLEKNRTCVVNHFFLLGQMILVGSNSWNVGIGPEKGGVVDDLEGMTTMRLLGENMAWLIEKLTL